ncbi:hypothetical protein [Streptomyces sp. CBMA152]|uniref:hypothetical protein n=1 Tax=Streptomyces sp. CBMA152 TaxID=1896312 RepID=UPI001660E579|nr:hypothetical protein [Streptomyces sp. CBMA152]
MTTDLNTLLTALYVKTDDEIRGTRCLGRAPLRRDSELVCLAVAQTLLGDHSEARWLRYANTHLTGMFSYLPQHPDYHWRLKAALPLLKREKQHHGEPMAQHLTDAAVTPSLIAYDH